GRRYGQQRSWPASIDKEIAACIQAEKAIADLAFSFTQAPEQIPGLLVIRVKALLKRKQPADALATAERFAAWAETADRDRDGRRYSAAGTFALCGDAEKALALL